MQCHQLARKRQHISYSFYHVYVFLAVHVAEAKTSDQWDKYRARVKCHSYTGEYAPLQ